MGQSVNIGTGAVILKESRDGLRRVPPFSGLERPLRTLSVRPVRPSLLPYLLRKPAPGLRRRGVDHRDSGVNRHRVRIAFHARDGGEPLAQRLRAFRLGIVLPGLPSDSRPAERIAAKHVAASAGPHQIVRRGVAFLPIDVAHFDTADSAT